MFYDTTNHVTWLIVLLFIHARRVISLIIKFTFNKLFFKSGWNCDKQSTKDAKTLFLDKESKPPKLYDLEIVSLIGFLIWSY